MCRTIKINISTIKVIMWITIKMTISTVKLIISTIKISIGKITFHKRESLFSSNKKEGVKNYFCPKHKLMIYCLDPSNHFLHLG